MAKPLDDVDRTIVQLLTVNGRITHEEVARQVHVSRPAVHERVKRLEREGVIRGYRALVHWPVIGLGLCAFVSVQIEHQQIGGALAQLGTLRVPHAMVEESHRVTGEWCALLKVRARSPQALQALLDRILEIPGVTQLSTSVVLSTTDTTASLGVVDGQTPRRLADEE